MSPTTTPALLQPAQVGALQLKHRVVMAPLTRCRASHLTLIPSDLAVDYYGQRATDGGLLITEATLISFEAGLFDHCPGIYSPEQISQWSKVTAAVHAKGGKIFMQLWALGRVADPTISPKVFSAGSKPLVQKTSDLSKKAEKSASHPSNFRMMTHADIDRFVEAFRQAALNAIEAGFDGVEIHGANGYLIDQFLQSVCNDRKDEYGGSLENRFRFPLRVLNAICSAIGPERVGIRMSPFSTFQGMREPNPLATFVPWTEAIIASQPDLAYIHMVEPRISGGSDVLEDLFGKEDSLEPIRDIATRNGIARIVAGGFTPETALEHAELTGDLIAMGRNFIANPDLPDRLKNTWPLAKYERSTFYTQTAEGYIDYPYYTAA